MGLDKITWPVVAVIGLVLTAVVTLGIVGADTTIITNVLLLLGLGGLIGVGAGVRSNVNGNLSRLIDHLSRSAPVVPDAIVTTTAVADPLTITTPPGV